MTDTLLNIILYILSGAGVGFLIGLTGIGGGSLMTPLLILFNIPYAVAIGTDLLYASITKAGGVFMHHRSKNIHWRIVFTMAAGSIPASILTALFLKKIFSHSEENKVILTTALGIMLIITAVMLLLKKHLQRYAATHQDPNKDFIHRYTPTFTFVCGILLGVCVTLSSVGAGVFGTAVLMMLYTRLTPRHIVGTDLAHAVPLTFVAGMSHFLLLDTVNFTLLGCLLIGSIPSVYIGTKVGVHLPEKVMYNILAVLLIVLGAKFVFQ